MTGKWLAALAGAGWLDHLLRALAIDGKWLRGVPEVKLFAAMLHQGNVVVGPPLIPEDTNEITQVRALLDAIGLDGVIVTADAGHAQHDTAAYLAGERGAHYLLIVKGNQPGLRDAISAKISTDCGAGPDHVALDYGHGRIVKHSLWVNHRRGHRLPPRRPGDADPQRHLRPCRRRAHQGNRARGHQRGRHPRHPRLAGADHPAAHCQPGPVVRTGTATESFCL